MFIWVESKRIAVGRVYQNTKLNVILRKFFFEIGQFLKKHFMLKLFKSKVNGHTRPELPQSLGSDT